MFGIKTEGRLLGQRVPKCKREVGEAADRVRLHFLADAGYKLIGGLMSVSAI